MRGAVVGSTKKEEVFEAYVEQVLAPALSPGRVVVLGNLLAAHKSERAHRLIEGRGCKLVFLPAYSSPDLLNPIEEVFSKVKALLRQAGARTRGALVEAIGRALDAVSAKDARGWSAHCCYAAGAQRS